MDKLTVDEDRDDEDEEDDKSVLVLPSEFKQVDVNCGGCASRVGVVEVEVEVEDDGAMTLARFDELLTIVIIPMFMAFFFDLNRVYIFLFLFLFLFLLEKLNQTTTWLFSSTIFFQFIY